MRGPDKWDIQEKGHDNACILDFEVYMCVIYVSRDHKRGKMEIMESISGNKWIYPVIISIMGGVALWVKAYLGETVNMA